MGLAVGIEREWSGHATGPGARFAGARTFLLLGLLGGAAGELGRTGFLLPAMSLLLGGVALSVAAYILAARRPTPEAVDGTTEAAALAVLALGTLAGVGALRLAAGTGAIIVLALREKSTIAGFVRRLDAIELRAALQFAVLALVLLPILPVGPYGPLGGVRPRELWLVVLLVSGLNFAGYLARRLVGDTRGTAVAGIFGGLVSSTAVALSFSRQSRDGPTRASPLVLGVVGACTVLLPRLTALTLALRPSLAPALAPLFLPPFLLGLLMLGVGLRRGAARDDGAASLPEGPSPLRLGSAILLAIGFQAVLMLMSWVRGRFGAIGVLSSAALLGLTDMDALTLSMTRLAGDPEQLPVAAAAIGIGVLSNTILKLGAVLLLGAGRFRRHAGLALGALALASIAGLFLARWL